VEDLNTLTIYPLQDLNTTSQGSTHQRQLNTLVTHEGQFYTVEDLNIGNTLLVHSRQFQLVNCDKFTANFLTKLGVLLNPPIPLPGDPYTQQRKMV